MNDVSRGADILYQSHGEPPAFWHLNARLALNVRVIRIGYDAPRHMLPKRTLFVIESCPSKNQKFFASFFKKEVLSCFLE